MLNNSWFTLNKRGFSHVLLVLVIVSLVSLGMAVGTTTKSSVSQNVLGVPCQSGGLSTSTNKVYQMLYPAETFLQLVNVDLLKDVSQLKDLTCLQYLDATDRTIKGDIANLKSLTNLEVLSLYSNPDVSGDICSLAEATRLRSLKLAFNPKITGDVSCLKNLTKLETFAMTDTQVFGDLSVFAGMPNLKALYINGTKIQGDICSLSKLTNMEELGIADEVGNPNITGDLVCLDNLQKLKRVSLYNTGATNCERFTKSHQNLANTTTESGKQGGGGCSKESRQTLNNQNQKYERKIGTDRYQGSPPDYSKEGTNGRSELVDRSRGKPNIFQRLVMWVFGLFGKTFPQGPGDGGLGAPGALSGEPSQKEREEKEALLKKEKGPGGCKSQAECQAYCSTLDHREECDKFGPPGGAPPN